MTEDQTIEQAIDAYRRQLTDAAELARGDLDEIEDHMRVLVAELRDGGMPAVAAVTEAARRIGEPRKVAIEHARVRGSFGPRLSRARAWGAAALMVPFVLYYLVGSHWVNAYTILESGISLMLAAALLARLSWARWFVVGTIVCTLPSFAIVGFRGGLHGVYAAQLVAYLAIVGLLVPWRRDELTPAAWVLLLMGPAYSAATIGLDWVMTDSNGVILGNPLGLMALGFVLLGSLGGMLRARWGAVATGLATLLLARTPATIPGFVLGTTWRIEIGVMLAIGILSAAIATVIGWRTARSTTGTLRHLVS